MWSNRGEEVGEESEEADEMSMEEVDYNFDDGSSGADEGLDYGDYVCAICDNGGKITVCEGKCMRSFHVTKKDGKESYCSSLGFTDEEVEAMKNVDFYCKNCKYKQHQCFSCGELGSSDESSTPEVFQCINGACGHFFHANCVAKLLHPEDKAAAAAQRRKIAAGEQFICPEHKCYVCRELEVSSDEKLQFAICRRCPRAYHRKCLPREISFEEDVSERRATIQRAWDELIPNRVLIYCLDHEIDEWLATPLRNHIKFPRPPSTMTGGYTPEKRSHAKPPKAPWKVSSDSMKREFSRNEPRKLPEPSINIKRKVDPNRIPVPAYGRGTKQEERVSGGHLKPQNLITEPKRLNSGVALDDDGKKRILTLMKDAYSSITLKDIKSRHKPPSTHASSTECPLEHITLGKIENSIEALRAALKQLEQGGNVEDAKAVCGDDILRQVMRWKEQLRVYMAPFLYGMRYTSYGRHFTKVDKLQKIVDMLHCYIKDGDMIVDFCCGSNDFSCLLRDKLNQVGKTCSFKNYDIVQAKNDFCFEKMDFMKVKPEDLPEGSRLIMGLNPPFGVKAALANKFINKALQFRPKLLILIVPRETERLERKRYPYDLIWEDDQMLAGKAFYLPGSIDVNHKAIEDWNVKAPVLYLWSSPKWTRKHKAIAEQHGHPLFR